MKRILFLLTLISHFAFAQQAKYVNPNVILLKFATKVKNNENLSLEFKTTSRNPKTNFFVETRGKQWIKGENFFMTHGEVEEIANGNKYWSILKDHGTVLGTYEKPYLTELFINQYMSPIWNDEVYAMYEREGIYMADKVHVIKMTPKDAKNALYESIVSYITKDTNELKKIVFFRKDGISTDFILEKVDFTSPIKNELFEFNASNYSGYTITDN